MTASTGSAPGIARPRNWRKIDRTLLSIQYLRAGAAVAVLVAHGAPALPLSVIISLAQAMDLFFLMSGFIVVVIAAENTRPLEFIRERVERIVPLYWLLTLVCYFLIYSGVLAPIFNPLRLVSNTLFGNVQFLLSSLFFYPVQSPFEVDLNPLMPQGWTLNYEMLFYVLFAAALFLPRRTMVPALTAVFVMMVLAGLAAQPAAPALRVWSSPLILEFIFGLWAGIAWRNGWDFRKLFVFMLLGWAPIAWAVLNTPLISWPFTPLRMTLLPFTLSIFLAVLALDRQPGRMKEWKPAKLIGDASYSIYLFHFIPIIMLDRVGQAMPVWWGTYLFVVLFGGIGGGLMVYWLIEQPIARWVKQRRQLRRAAAVAL